MLHKFFQNDLQKDFIQNVVSSTPLPIYHTVSDGDYIIKDKYYFYYRYLIKCTKTGIINYNGEISETNRKCMVAQYEIIQDYVFGDFIQNATEKVTCNSGFYDQQTHHYLGTYLRALRDLKNINLMQMYNCFDYTAIDSIQIDQFNSEASHCFSFKDNNNTFFSYYLMPIQFNRKYTLALECIAGAKILPVLYSNRGPLFSTVDNTYFGDKYKVSTIVDTETVITPFFRQKNLNNVSFYNPYYFEIDTSILTEDEESELFELENNLFLLLQLPYQKTQKSIVLLEGEYSPRVVDMLPKFPTSISPRELDKFTNSQPALMQMADEHQYAYNDKIIQYLLEHPVTGYEEIEGNVKYLQELVFDLLKKDLPKFKVDKSGKLIQIGGELISYFELADFDSDAYKKDDLYERDVLFKAEYKFNESDERNNMVQGKFKDDSLTYIDFVEDVWSNILRLLVYHLYMDNTKGNKLDINGYLDNDTERFLVEKLGEKQ